MATPQDRTKKPVFKTIDALDILKFEAKKIAEGTRERVRLVTKGGIYIHYLTRN